MDERIRLTAVLFANIKREQPKLKELLKNTDAEEDCVYRFYHQSFKVYGYQAYTLAMVEQFKAIAPEGGPLNEWFLQIVAEGTGKKFEMEHNREWLKHTRAIVEAFEHARYFLRMICKYGEELESPPDFMPFGWAAVLELYNIR